MSERLCSIGMLGMCISLLSGCFPEIKIEATNFPPETTTFRFQAWQSSRPLPEPPLYQAATSSENHRIDLKGYTGTAYTFDLDLPNISLPNNAPLAVTVGAFDASDCLLAVGTNNAIAPFSGFDITTVNINLEINADLKRPDQCKTSGPILQSAELTKIYSAGDDEPTFQFSATGYGFDPLSSIVISLNEDVTIGPSTVTKGKYRFCSAFPANDGSSPPPTDCLPDAAVVAASSQSLTVNVKESNNRMAVKLAKVVFASSEFMGLISPTLTAKAYVVNEKHGRHATTDDSNTINVLK